MPRGKELKKGKQGKASLYMTRDRAMFKLQVTLRDFRKLCILKGIYPRVPPNTVKKKNKTYYHVKDIQFLMHDPIIDSIRAYKTYRKKLRKFHFRHEHARAVSLKKHNKPDFNFDHMVKERYPTFIEAVKDLDDALSMVFLFASLPQNRFLKHWVVDRCVRLSHEWTSYIIRSRTLKKSFLSIKGVYFQASIMGEACTWLVPYPYTPSVPRDVDFKVMLTFLEFHMKHLEFVMFRLYHGLGLSYPPAINAALAGGGATILAYQFQAVNALENKNDDEAGSSSGDNDDDGVDDEDEIQNEEQAKAIEAEVEKISKSLHQMGMDVTAFDEAEAADNEMEAQNELLEAAGAEFRELAALEGQEEWVASADPLPTLFRGLVFFVGRENLRDVLYSALASCGAKVGWEGDDSPFDADYDGITHVVCDRPSLSAPRVDVEYVQPQWVFDSINYAFVLPVAEYVPGVELPPHLSPFVNDDEEGYVPERKQAVLRLIEESKGMAPADVGPADAEEAAELDARDAEDLYEEGLAQEQGLLQPKEGQDAAARVQSRRRERQEAEINEREEEKALQSGLLSRKKRRLYDRITYTRKRKESRSALLKKKAQAFGKKE